MRESDKTQSATYSPETSFSNELLIFNNTSKISGTFMEALGYSFERFFLCTFAVDPT